MRRHLPRWIAGIVLLLSAIEGISCLDAAEVGDTATAVAKVQTALNRLSSWLDSNANGKAWRTYLLTNDLEREISKGPKADPKVVSKSLGRFKSGHPGLELPQFAEARHALEALDNSLGANSANDLTALLSIAKTQFQPPADAEIAQAKAKLSAALAPLDTFLGPGTNGQNWRTFLRWNDLRAQLALPSPDVPTLVEIEKRFSADKPGLEMPAFTAAENALRHYLNLNELKTTADVGDLFAKQVEELATLSTDYGKTPSELLAAKIQRSLQWLSKWPGAAGLVKAARRGHAQPNLYAYASEFLIGAGIQRSINDVTPLRDNIMDTQIVGTGQTVGFLGLKLVPDPNRGMFEAILRGKTYSRTTGYNGPATIHTQGTTQLFGVKRLSMDAMGLTGLSTTATASTSTRVTGVSAGNGGLFGRIIQRVATKRVGESKAEAEQIASQHARSKLQQRIDADVALGLAKANADYVRKFRNPLKRLGQFPELLKFATTKDFLSITALQADSTQLGASDMPPSLVGHLDLGLQVHETMVNNFVSALLAGQTLTDESVRERIIQTQGALPEKFKNNNDPPFSITFADFRPVIVTFADNGLKITIQGTSYTSGPTEETALKTIKDVNVTAFYKLEHDERGAAILKRQGELELVPPNYDPAKGKLPLRVVAPYGPIRRKFDKVFERQIDISQMELSGAWKKAGKFALTDSRASKGWLVASWIRAASAPAASPGPVRTARRGE